MQDADQRLLERFVRLCETTSPSGSERAVADAVLAELRALGVEAVEDEAAVPARAGAGNVIARVPGETEGWVMFCAHLDTVPHEGEVEPVLADGVYRSAGETILGADNKAAVAVLLELAARGVERRPPLGLELVFTVAEEDGLRGAKELDVSSLRSPFGFVLDHASPIGEIIVASPTYYGLEARFSGVEAHAGLRPEGGQSAIDAAATAISAMQLGRLDPETTANVGLIEGGTAPNVVAGSCRIAAEARSLDSERAAEVVQSMLDACTWTAGEAGCDLEVDVREVFRGYRVRPSAEPLAVAREALRRCGHEPREVETGGGSDANALSASGFECVLLANGTEANHTTEESVAAKRIVEMVAVCEAIAAEVVAREGARP